MTIGEKILNLRKQKNLSQESIANSLNVSRQTISKWETDQSTPDFDKIGPLCDLFGISADELVREDAIIKEKNTPDTTSDFSQNKRKKARGIGLGILLYFISVAFIMVSIPVLMMNPILASAIFLIICGVATYIIVYSCLVYKTKKKEDNKEVTLIKQIQSIIGGLFLIIYLLVSFITMAWHITWILWVVAGLVEEIVKLIFMLRGGSNEK